MVACVAAVLAINRLCDSGSELAVEQRWYPATALDDLLRIEEGRLNATRLYRCLDRLCSRGASDQGNHRCSTAH